VVLNVSEEARTLAGTAGTVRLCTDRAREGEIVEGDLALPAHQGLVLERS
jgi:hypothetical protein